MDIDEVKERLSQLGYTTKESDKTALLFCINRVEEHIKNVCNISAVPEELYYKSIDMACGEFLEVKLVTGELDGYTLNGENNRLIKTISEGDTTITYQDTSSDSYGAMSGFISQLKADDRELYRFRRLVW